MHITSTIQLHSGTSMPLLGLGTWKLTNNTAEAVEQALGIGYRLIDTSSDYGSQQGIGEALQHTSIDRKEIFLETKVEETDDAYEATKEYLAEMQQEYADMIVIHRPPENGAGKELWKGLIKAREDGLTKDIGVSNYSAKQIDTLIQETNVVPTVNQIEWSPFGHSMKMKEYCDAKNIIIQAYSPLTRTERLDDPTLSEVASKHNKTSAQILLRWNLQLGTVPLPKANQLDHQKENINIFDFELDQDDMEKLTKLNENYSSLGELPYI